MNSVGETLQVSPVDVFNIVLCASNKENDKDVVKKMYNWWKGVFEILSTCDVPDDRKKEYDDLVDALMAEISKTGNDVKVNESEEYGYEQADIEDEDAMLKDMEFAISKIGEIANRVQDLINFVNPYCQSFNEDKIMKFKKINENGGEWIDMDDLIGVPQSDPREDDLPLKTEGFSDFNDDGKDPIISYEDEGGNHSVMVVSGHDEMGDTVYQVKMDEEEWTTTSNLEEAKMEASKLVDKINKRKDVDYQLMPVDDANSDKFVEIDDNIPVDVYDIEWDVDDDEELEELPTEVTVDVPFDVIKQGAWAVDEYISDYLSDEYGFTHYGFEYDKGEVMKYNDNPFMGLPSPEDIEAMDLGLVDAKDILPKRLKKADESNVMVNVNDVWELLKVLEDDEASNNLKSLIDSHVRSEAEIMDVIDELYPENVTQIELNNVFATGMEEIVDALGLDVDAYMKDGSFVDTLKPSKIAAEGDGESNPVEVKDGEKKFKGDDGEVKTLDNADKKVVSEMTVEQEIDDPWKLSEMMWGQGQENLQELLRSDVVGEEEVMQMLEDMGIRDLTGINDVFAFEFREILESLGLDGKAWSNNLEIKRKDDDEE